MRFIVLWDDKANHSTPFQLCGVIAEHLQLMPPHDSLPQPRPMRKPTPRTQQDASTAAKTPNTPPATHVNVMAQKQQWATPASAAAMSVPSSVTPPAIYPTPRSTSSGTSHLDANLTRPLASGDVDRPFSELLPELGINDSHLQYALAKDIGAESLRVAVDLLSVCNTIISILIDF